MLYGHFNPFIIIESLLLFLATVACLQYTKGITVTNNGSQFYRANKNKINSFCIFLSIQTWYLRIKNS